MPRNIGTADRVLRILAGLAILSLTVTGPQTPWGFLGLIPLLTGIVRFCPAYTVLGVSTCPR